MKKIIAILLSAVIAAACAPKEDVLDYVNPNIGTVNSRWFVFTPAATPFGLAKLGAATNASYGNRDGWEAVGYDDSHTSIEGFPCFHEFQVGGLALMPVTGEPVTQPGLLEDPAAGWRSSFDKTDEFSQAGYYSVILKDYDVKAELTATERVGFQRFTFNGDQPGHILVNVGTREGESGAVLDAFAKVDGNIIQGWMVTKPVYVIMCQPDATVDMFFYGELSKAPDSSSAFHVGGEREEAVEVSGSGAVLSLDYDNPGQITVKLGLSYTSIDNAKANLEAEAANLTFDAARKQTQDKWRKALGKLEVEGGKEGDKVKFYTGLYHALLGRGLASDVNGAYPAHDGSIGQIECDSAGKPKHNHYNTDCIWGGYWNLTPLWALAYPEYYNDWVASQLLIYKDSGWLGDGIACSKYVSGVGTNMVPIAFAGAYNNGIRDYDIETMYAAARKDCLEWEARSGGAGKHDMKQFLENGYVPYLPGFVSNPEGASFSVSHTLEYCFCSYATAQLAKQLGHEEDYQRLMELSEGWTKLFDDEMKLVRPRVPGGDFIDNFDPFEPWRGFQEGNAVQYTFFVPHHIDSLQARLGGDVFNQRLDSIFTEARKSIFGGGKTTHAFSGLNSPYNHGNQPCLHEPWLFNFSGKPYLTQKWVRLICDEFYGTDG
ncbi:MAG: GH92 family glycosyl hydrolase, partial [Bacteroidales bacterium]|nr:GH92 family glycosyl hydrolase [Bacteroidales bacterium]